MLTGPCGFVSPAGPGAAALPAPPAAQLNSVSIRLDADVNYFLLCVVQKEQRGSLTIDFFF